MRIKRGVHHRQVVLLVRNRVCQKDVARGQSCSVGSRNSAWNLKLDLKDGVQCCVIGCVGQPLVILWSVHSMYHNPLRSVGSDTYLDDTLKR